MPVEPSHSSGLTVLPFKLRFKEGEEANAQEVGQQAEATTADVSLDARHSISQANGDGGLKASKIAGIAPRKAPRVGPEYQADIPDLQG